MHTRRSALASFATLAAAPALAEGAPASQPLPHLPPLEKDLRGEETALVDVDFQNAFAHHDGEHFKSFQPQFEKTGMIDKSVDLVKRARAAGIQVVHVTEAYTPDYRELDWENGGGFHRAQLVRQAWKVGSFGVQLYEPMRPGADDRDILLPNRLTLSGFGTNGLDTILKSRGVRNVAVMGFTSDICCYATTLAAYDLGYRVYAISDAMVGADAAASAAMMNYCYPKLSRLMTADDFMKMFARKA
jgi:ureidoacrylate peracid hydrolase